MFFGISDFLEEIPSLSHSVVFLYFFALIAEEGFLISSFYSLELCIQMLISFLFPLLFASLFFTAMCKASADSLVFCQENALVITNTRFQQHKRRLYMDITRWSTPKSDWLYFCSQRWRSSIQSAKTRPGADCGWDHEFLNAKFRLKLKKVGKTTRPFRYDLNQIPYDYTVEVRNRFKGLDLIDRVPDELWNEVRDIV